MKRGNPLLCLCAIGALVLAFGCGRQAFALSIKDINNGQISNGQVQKAPPGNASVNKTAEMAKPFPGKWGIEKPVVPSGSLKPKSSNIVPINPPPASPLVPVAPNPNAKKPWPGPWNQPNPWHPSFEFQYPMPACGHYEIVTETVMVEPEHVEKFWVQPEYQTVIDPSGTPQIVKVKGGYLAERVVPARYETIQRQVWVQDSHPGIGFGFKF